MKHFIFTFLIVAIVSMPSFASPPPNQAEFLYGNSANRNKNSSPVKLDYYSGHTYTRSANNTYIRDDGVEIRKDNASGFVETSRGERYMPIGSGKNSYYVKTDY